jgi:hypothetical protein
LNLRKGPSSRLASHVRPLPKVDSLQSECRSIGYACGSSHFALDICPTRSGGGSQAESSFVFCEIYPSPFVSTKEGINRGHWIRGWIPTMLKSIPSGTHAMSAMIDHRCSGPPLRPQYPLCLALGWTHAEQIRYPRLPVMRAGTEVSKRAIAGVGLPGQFTRQAPASSHIGEAIDDT